MSSPRIQTKMIHSGGPSGFNVVNMPPVRAATLTFSTVDAYERALHGEAPSYARYGTPTAAALCEALVALDGGIGATLTPSGLTAVAVALMATTAPGDHLLMCKGVYEPTKRFCAQRLAKYGVTTSLFDPGRDNLVDHLRPNTTAVFLESPTSNTFEIFDVKASARLAREHGCLVIMDNTWGTPVFYRPLEYGVDIVVHSATKYLSGHSDLIMGAIVCGNESANGKVRALARELGLCVSVDDCYLVLRGLRTLDVRMNRHYENALHVANWLRSRPEVRNVHYPALAGAPGHELWARDYTGACGLFAVELHAYATSQLHRTIESLRWFAIGASWGGHESLILPVASAVDPASSRPAQGPMLRLHIGLEHPLDLIEDLQNGFELLEEESS